MSAGDVTALKRAYALVCPTLCTNATQGPPGPAGPATDLTTNPVGSFYSNQTQNISTTSTSIWTLNQSTFQRSVAITSNSRINVYISGVYEIYYSAQITATAGASGRSYYTYIWLKKNGVDVPETNGRIEGNSNNGDTLPIVPYIIELNAGDYLEFAARTTEGDDNHIIILASTIGAGYGPAIPSLIVGIKRIG